MTGETKPGANGRAAVAALPCGATGFLRYLPSGRSLLIAFATVVTAVGSYALARETAMFAVRKVDVIGAPPGVAAHVRAALKVLDGTSLLALDGGALEHRLTALPDVASASYDRDFPHTLRVFVQPERPVGVLRRGAKAWLVSARARVIRKVSPHGLPALARVWLPSGTQVEVGQTLVGATTARAVEALATLRAAGARLTIRNVRSTDRELTLLLGSGLEVRLGNGRALALKLAIARRIASQLTGPGYLDVSVPERPVAGPNSQPGG